MTTDEEQIPLLWTWTFILLALLFVRIHRIFQRSACMYAAWGCRERLTLGQKDAHERICGYRHVECRYRVNGCAFLFLAKNEDAHARVCSHRPAALQSAEIQAILPDEHYRMELGSRQLIFCQAF